MQRVARIARNRAWDRTDKDNNVGTHARDGNCQARARVSVVKWRLVGSAGNDDPDLDRGLAAHHE